MSVKLNPTSSNDFLDLNENKVQSSAENPQIANNENLSSQANFQILSEIRKEVEKITLPILQTINLFSSQLENFNNRLNDISERVANLESQSKTQHEPAESAIEAKVSQLLQSKEKRNQVIKAILESQSKTQETAKSSIEAKVSQLLESEEKFEQALKIINEKMQKN